MSALRAGIVLAAAVTAGQPCSAARVEAQPDGPPPVCAIEVEFHTRQTEIDMATLDRVLQFVETVPAIEKAFDARRPTGEPATLCLVIGNPNEAVAIYEKLTLLVPAQSRRLPRIKPRPGVVLRLNGG